MVCLGRQLYQAIYFTPDNETAQEHPAVWIHLRYDLVGFCGNLQDLKLQGTFVFHQVTTGSLGCFELAPDHGMAFTPQAMTLMATFEPTPSPTSESAPALNSGPTPGPTSVQPEHLLQDSYEPPARPLALVSF